jgi:hypothetical protein
MWEIAIKVVGLLGGVAAVAAGIAALVSKIFSDSWLESHKSQLQKEVERLKADLAKDQENHKLSLKRKEILFSREIDAAKAFFEIRQRISPTYSFPEKEWADVIEETIEDFSEIEKELGNFVKDHGPFLNTDTRGLIDECENFASQHKFHASGHGSDTQKQAEEAAETVLTKLREIEQKFIHLLQS